MNELTTIVSSAVNVRFRTSDAKIVADLVEERIATYANWIDSALESNNIERAKRLSAERRNLISHVRANFNQAFGV